MKSILYALGILGLCLLIGVWAQGKAGKKNRDLVFPDGMSLRVIDATFGTDHQAPLVSFRNYLDNIDDWLNGRAKISRSFGSAGWTMPAAVLWCRLSGAEHRKGDEGYFTADVEDENGWPVFADMGYVGASTCDIALHFPRVPWHSKTMRIRFYSFEGKELASMVFTNPLWQKPGSLAGTEAMPAARSTNGIECVLERLVAVACGASNSPCAMAVVRLRGPAFEPREWTIGYVTTADANGNRMESTPVWVRRSGNRYLCMWQPALWPGMRWTVTLYPKPAGTTGMAPDTLVECRDIALPCLHDTAQVTSVVTHAGVPFTAWIRRSPGTLTGQAVVIPRREWLVKNVMRVIDDRRMAYSSMLLLYGSRMGEFPPAIDVIGVVDDRGIAVEVRDVRCQTGSGGGFPSSVFALPSLSTNAHSISITLGPQRAVPFTFTVMPEIIWTNTNIDNVAGDLL